jgi:hypothetical protein
MSNIPSDAEPKGSPSRYRQQAGIGHVPSYQVAATPYITGTLNLYRSTETAVIFPRVTRAVTLRNTGAAPLRVTFASKTDNGHGGNDVHAGLHYITVDASGSAAATHAQGIHNQLTMNIKCERLYVYNPEDGTDGKFELFAELTHIPTGSWTLTGTGISSPIGT